MNIHKSDRQLKRIMLPANVPLDQSLFSCTVLQKVWEQMPQSLSLGQCKCHNKRTEGDFSTFANPRKSWLRPCLCLALHTTPQTYCRDAGVTEPHIQNSEAHPLPILHLHEQNKSDTHHNFYEWQEAVVSPQCLALFPHEDIVTKKATEHTSTCPLHRTPSETARVRTGGGRFRTPLATFFGKIDMIFTLLHCLIWYLRRFICSGKECCSMCML